jgi:hypothetical protein
VLKPASPTAARDLAGPGQPVLLVERQLGEPGPLLVGQRDHRVVEPGDGDPAVLVVQRGQQPGQRGQRVGDRAAERAGVQVDVRAVEVDLAAGQPAHAGRRGREVAGEHAGVGDHRDVRGDPVPPVAQQVGEVRRAGLLLALDEEAQRDRRGVPAGRGQVRAQAEQVEQQLALVVGGTAGVELLATDRSARTAG